MFKNLKLALQTFKKNIADYLSISFVFSVIVYIGVLVGQSLIGMLAAYVVIIIPAIISFKFCMFQSYDKAQVEYRSLKIGFLTFFKSIKIYFIVILKPFLIGLLVGIIAYSFFMNNAINIASDTIPNLLKSLSNYETAVYAFEDMMKIDKASNILKIGGIISISIGYLVYFSLKLRRDFIPFIAFEMPINSKRSLTMNEKILKGQYFKFFLNNLIIILMVLFPAVIAYFTYKGLNNNAIYSDTTVLLITSLVMCVLSGPIIAIKQLHYIYAYKSFSKPYKEDFDNELKNVIKEIEELQKFIDNSDDKNDEK